MRYVIFREMSALSAQLMSERGELSNALRSLHEKMLELHDKMIMELQVLYKENSNLRSRLNGGKTTDSNK